LRWSDSISGQGIAAFGRGQYAAAVQHLEPVRDIAHRFGGSHAQRDLLILTLIEAAARANQRSRAKHYLTERLVHKPTPWAQAGAPDRDGAQREDCRVI
jgi:hypothetical protein